MGRTMRTDKDKTTKMAETMDAIEAELAEMRTRLEQLRVTGSLGKMELRDRLHAFNDAFDPAYRRAQQAIAELARSGVRESRTLARSVEAGWNELRKTHRELSAQADRERAGRPS